LNLDDFIQKVNSDLVGKVEYCQSLCKFINKDFNNTLSATVLSPELFKALLMQAIQLPKPMKT
jgi:methionyl-tRNA synthetase